jgi:hypothetical protein
LIKKKENMSRQKGRRANSARNKVLAKRSSMSTKQARIQRESGDERKLFRVLGMLDGTIGSVCDYSAAALVDRMKLMAAIIRDDEKGMATFGQLCHEERAEQTAREPA